MKTILVKNLSWIVELHLTQSPSCFINRTLLIVLHSFYSNLFVSAIFLWWSDQLLSPSSRLVVVILVWWLILKSTVAIFIISFAIVLVLLWSVLLVPHWSINIWVLFGKSILLACHRTCYTLSPPTLRLDFIRKYFLHTLQYLLRPAVIKFWIIIIVGPFFCSNLVWLLCTLNHPGLLSRGVANISIVFFSQDYN